MNKKHISPEIYALTGSILSRWALCEVRDATGARSSQTVHKWKISGNIPPQYRQDIMNMAVEDGFKLSPVEEAYLKSTDKIPLIEDLLRSLTDRLTAPVGNHRSPFGPFS